MATSIQNVLAVLAPYQSACTKVSSFFSKKDGLVAAAELLSLLQALQDKFILKVMYGTTWGMTLDALETVPLSSLLFSLKTSGYQNDIDPKRVEHLLLNATSGLLVSSRNVLQLPQIDFIKLAPSLREDNKREIVSGRHRTVAFALMLIEALNSAHKAGSISPAEFKTGLKLALAQRVPVLSYDMHTTVTDDEGNIVYKSARAHLHAMLAVYNNDTRSTSSIELETAKQFAAGVVPGKYDSYLAKLKERDFANFGGKDFFKNVFYDYASGFEYTGVGEYAKDSQEWFGYELQFTASSRKVVLTRTKSPVQLSTLAECVYKTLCDIDDTTRPYEKKVKGQVVRKYDQVFKPGIVGYEPEYTGNQAKWVANPEKQALHTDGVLHLLSKMFMNENIDWSLSINDAQVLDLIDGLIWIEAVLSYAVYDKAGEFNVGRDTSSIRKAIQKLAPSLQACLDKQSFYPESWFGTVSSSSEELTVEDVYEDVDMSSVFALDIDDSL